MVITTFLLWGPAAWAETDDIPRIMEQAQQKFVQEEYSESLSLYRRVVELEPANIEAWSRLGLLLSWENRLPESIEAYRSALDLVPGDPELRSSLARVLAWKGDLSESARLYTELIEERPGDLQARLGLARTLSWANRFDEAITVYRHILERDPKNIEARMGIARVQSWSDRFDEAIASYCSVLEDSPDNVEAQLGIARVLAWSDDLAAAIKKYESILEENPESADAHAGLGDVRRWQGMNREAYSHTERALELNPNHDDARKSLRLLRLATAPELSPVFTTVKDSDNNQLQIYGTDAAVSLDPQTRFRLSYRNFYNRNPDQELSGRAEVLTANVSTRFSPELAMNASLGTVSLDPHQAQGQSETIGGLNFQVTPHPDHHLVVGYNREILVETAQLVENAISMDTVDLGYRMRLPADNELRLGYARSTFSDQNSRNVYSASFAHRIRGMTPDLRVGASFRQLDYARRTFSGYFNPPTFQVGEVFAEMERRDPDDPWIYSLGGAAGYQTIDVEDPQFVYRLSAGVGYRFNDNAEIELSGLTTTSAISSIQGFQYTAGTVRMRFRF